MPLNLYIDTNIFLKFYHFSNDDLEELRKLSVLLNSKTVILFLPQQTIDELKRNRENKIVDALKPFEQHKSAPQFPQFFKGYPEYDQLIKTGKEFDKLRSQLREKLMEDIQNETLKADGVINDLITKGQMIPTTDELLQKAKTRFDLGNPPGKDKSYGDALNWEVLLLTVPDSETLYFISDDQDYFSKIDKERFNSFLLEEWGKRKSGGEIRFYKSLSEFFKVNFPNIHLADELEKDTLILELVSSSSFARTRSTLQKISKYDSFTSKQLNDIVLASITNNQIYWIIEDEDIRDMLNLLIKGREDIIEPENLKQFNQFFESKNSEASPFSFDDLPF